MSATYATRCDRAGCLAVHLSDAGTTEQAAEAARADGWAATADDATCPGCQTGRGPVLELGECRVCLGRTVSLADGERCHYCRTVTPYTPDDSDHLTDCATFEPVDLADLDAVQLLWLPDPIPEGLRVLRCTECGEMRAEMTPDS